MHAHIYLPATVTLYQDCLTEYIRTQYCFQSSLLCAGIEECRPLMLNSIIFKRCSSLKSVWQTADLATSLLSPIYFWLSFNKYRNLSMKNSESVEIRFSKDWHWPYFGTRPLGCKVSINFPSTHTNSFIRYQTKLQNIWGFRIGHHQVTAKNPIGKIHSLNIYICKAEIYSNLFRYLIKEFMCNVEKVCSCLTLYTKQEGMLELKMFRSLDLRYSKVNLAWQWICKHHMFVSYFGMYR